MTMKKARRTHLFMIAAAAVFSMVAGCSCDQDESLSRVRKAGRITIATSAGYSPFSFYNDKKELIGFDIDVAKELAKRLSVDLEIVDTPWEGILNGLNARRYDGILGSMSVTEARRSVVGFSTPYYYSRTCVMVKVGSPFKKQANLQGKTIGVAAGTTFERDAGRIGAKNIRHYASDDEALMGLQRGEVDAVITDEIVSTYMATRKKVPIKRLGDTLGEEQIAAVFRKEDKTLLAEVNHALKAMQKDGFIRDLIDKMAKKGY